ncbi:MAG: hypothetical protein AB1807_01390 [Pseudomonadota bacterium]|jgi:hypothetical protein
MKKTLAVTMLALCSFASSAQAASKVGFAPAATTSGGESDPLMSRSDIQKAVVEGMRAAGVPVDQGHEARVVSLDYNTLYEPRVNNLRTISGSIALREMATVRGAQKRVAVCDYSFNYWRVGPSVSQHVSGLLGDLHELGRKFAKECVK